MNVLLQIGHNDLRLFLKDKVSYVWLFLVPLLFMYFMGSAMRGPGDPADPNPTLQIENRDDGFMGKVLERELASQGVRLVSEQEEQRPDRIIRIPNDFTSRVLATNRVEIEYASKSGSSMEAAMLVEARLIRTLVALNATFLEAASENGRLSGGLNEATLVSALEQEESITLDSSYAGRQPIPVGFHQSLPGILVMFLLLNLLIFGGSSISEDRKSGVLARFAVYPVAKWELVMGKVYGRWLLGAVQITFFVIVGPRLFGVEIGHQLFGIVVVLLLFAWLSASLGVMVGALAGNVESTVALCVLFSMLLAALGGCWWPLEVVPDWLQTAGHLFPTAWAMDALHQLISFGADLSSITEEIALLAGLAIAANLLAGRLLRFSNG